MAHTADADWMTAMMMTTAAPIFVTVGSSVKLAANRESFALEGKFTGAEEEGKAEDELFEVVGVSPAICRRNIVVGRRVASPMVHVVGLLDSS